MGRNKLDPKRGPDKHLRQVGLLATIPAILFVAPGIGYLIGSWADGKFGTEPYLLIVGILLGFGAAGIEVYRLARKSEEIEREDDEKK